MSMELSSEQVTLYRYVQCIDNRSLTYTLHCIISIPHRAIIVKLNCVTQMSHYYILKQSAHCTGVTRVVRKEQHWKCGLCKAVIPVQVH